MMAVLHVSPELASLLYARAEQTQQSVEELLTHWVNETGEQPHTDVQSTSLLTNEDEDDELVFPEAFAELLELSKDWEWKPEDPKLAQRTSRTVRQSMNDQYEERLSGERNAIHSD